LQKDITIISEEVNTYFSDGHTIISQMLTNVDFKEYIVETDLVEEKRNYDRYKEVSLMLNSILNSNSKLLNVWIGIEKINDLLTDESDYDTGDKFIYTERPWFIDMIKEDGVITFTDPYVDLIKDVNVITVVSPVFDENHMKGVVGIDISIDQIEQYISTYDIGINGNVKLLNNSLDVLNDSQTNTQDSYIEIKIKSLMKKRISQGTFNGIEKIKIDDEIYYMGYARVEYPEWYIVSILPEDDVFYNSKLLKLLDTNSLIALLALIILMFPLYNLRKSYNSLNIAHAELIVKESELREIAIINEAFNNQLIASELELHKQHEEIEEYSHSIIEQQNYIRKLAENDPLTGLPNRRIFFNRLKTKLENKKHGLVIMIDLDNFKEINDLHGHVYGDKILCLVAEELKKLESDRVNVSRYGGDEFLILIDSDLTKSKEELILNNDVNISKLIQNINKNYFIEKDPIFIQGSFGIATFPYDAENHNDLLKFVDLAMYSIKNNNHDSFAYYNNEMIEVLIKKDAADKVLRKAFKNLSFELLYQPIVDCETGMIKSFEALLRMKNRELSPDEFIPIAESNGLIIPIGRWVLEQAIKTLDSWQKKGFKLKPIAINFSEVQLHDKEFIPILDSLLRQYNIPGKYIEIEITESILLDNNEEVVSFFNKIFNMGVNLSLDDFGTGYATLSYLDYIPLSKLKIDKTLIDKEYREQKENSLVIGIIALAHSLNMSVVAEGVELRDQAIRLVDLNCDSIQGYYFSKPRNYKEEKEIYNIQYDL